VIIDTVFCVFAVLSVVVAVVPVSLGKSMVAKKKVVVFYQRYHIQYPNHGLVVQLPALKNADEPETLVIP
jgi:hypothetical protein